MICASFRNHIARLGILSALLSGAAIAETPPSPTHAWFRTTPLQSSYQLLVEGHPTQAWHELIHTLSTTPVAEPFWQPIKEAILSQTQCGQALPSASLNDLAIAVTFIHKFNQTFQGYQVRLSAENLSQPLAVRLASSQGATLLAAELAPADYAEVESRDLLSPYAAGVYWLTLGEQRMALLISALPAHRGLNNPARPISLSASPPRLRAAHRHWLVGNFLIKTLPCCTHKPSTVISILPHP